MSVDELVGRMKKASLDYYHELPEEIIITGGETTLNKSYLLDLVSKLGFSDVILETNGYFLNAEYVDELVKAGLDEVMLDLKVYDEGLHKWYTNFSNQPILDNIGVIQERIKLLVKTVYIPGIIDEVEIE